MGVPVRGRLGGLCHQASVTNRSGFRWLLCLLSSLVLCIWVISWKKVRIHDLRFVVLIKQLLKEEKEKVNIEYTSCFYVACVASVSSRGSSRKLGQEQKKHEFFFAFALTFAQ